MTTTVKIPERALPGQLALDEGLARATVGALQRHARQHGLQDRLRVAEIILRSFFDGRPELLRVHGRRHATYQAVMKSPESGLSTSALWYAVAIFEQAQRLPPAIALALPVSHHRILLHVRDPIVKQRLAQRARDEGLSKRELEDLVRRVAPSPPRGRGGQALVRHVQRMRATLELVGEFTVRAPELDGLSVSHLATLADELPSMLQRVEALAETLRQAEAAVADARRAREAQAAK